MLPSSMFLCLLPSHPQLPSRGVQLRGQGRVRDKRLLIPPREVLLISLCPHPHQHVWKSADTRLQREIHNKTSPMFWSYVF